MVEYAQAARKICIVLPDFAIIGAQRVAIDAGMRMEKLGYEVVWAIGSSEHPTPQDLYESEVHFFEITQLRSVPLLRLVGRILKLAFLLRGIKVDRVFSVAPFINRVLCALKKIRIYQAELILEDHAYPPRSYLDEFKSPFVRCCYKATERFYNQATVLRTLTRDSKCYYSKSVHNAQIIEFPNLMDFSRLDRLANRGSYDGSIFDLAYVGRLESQKNISMLIEVVNVLVKHRGYSDLSVAIIGYGSEKQSLEALAVSLNLDNNITFLNTSDDNFSIIKEAKIFPLTSIWEGFPLVIIEAMYLGTAVVSVDCKTGPRLLLGENSERGILVEENNIQAFADGISLLLENEVQRSEIQINAREFVCANLNIESRFETYLRDVFKL